MTGFHYVNLWNFDFKRVPQHSQRELTKEKNRTGVVFQFHEIDKTEHDQRFGLCLLRAASNYNQFVFQQNRFKCESLEQPEVCI